MTDHDTTDRDTTPVDWLALSIDCPELRAPVLSPYELANERLHSRELDDLLWCVAWDFVGRAETFSFDGLEAFGPLRSAEVIADTHEFPVAQVEHAITTLLELGALTIIEPTDRYPTERYIFDIDQLPQRIDTAHLITTDGPVLALPEPKRAPAAPKRMPWLTGLVLAFLAFLGPRTQQGGRTR